MVYSHIFRQFGNSALAPMLKIVYDFIIFIRL